MLTGDMNNESRLMLRQQKMSTIEDIRATSTSPNITGQQYAKLTNSNDKIHRSNKSGRNSKAN